jgi:lactoylglutathione lyase
MVESMEASLRFYVDGLRFVMKNRWIDDGVLRWCWLEQDGVALMLQEWKEQPGHATRPAGRVGLGVSFNFNCRDALAVYRTLKERGPPARRPFVGNAMWVVSLEDPDGYNVHFQSPTDAPEESEYTD